MNRKQILNRLRALENPDKLRESDYQQYIYDISEYVKKTPEPTKRDPRYVDVNWLQKRMIEDMPLKCDGAVFTKVNSYIHQYEEEMKDA